MLHAWAMVGYDYKSELIFFDINDQIEEDPLWALEITEQEGLLLPVPALETTEEEQRLMGESNCKHNCKDKTACKHECCKGYKSKKKGGNMTQTQYLEWIFKPYIEPEWRRHQSRGEPFILLEDNDGCHSTRSDNNPVIRFKRALKGFMWYANPPQSPDLNIIENCWRIIKQRVKQRKPTTVDELKQYIIEEWASIPQEKINKMVDTMPKRITECHKRGGLQTPF